MSYKRKKYHFYGGQIQNNAIDAVINQDDDANQKEETIESFLDYLYQKGKEEPNKPMVIHRNNVVEGFYLNYLLKKFGSECYFNYSLDRMGITQSFYIDKYDEMKHNEFNTIESALAFKKRFKSCIKNENLRVIIIPLSLQVSSADKHQIVGHANVIICRKVNNNEYVFEHFEPHGSDYQGDSDYGDSIADVIQKYYLNDLGITYKYERSNKVCPVFRGIQTTYDYDVGERNGGYCVMWTMFFIEICLRNPTLSSDIVFKRIMAHVKKDTIQYVIKGFTKKMTEKIKKYYTEIIKHHTGNDFDLSTFFDKADNKKWYELDLLLHDIITRETRKPGNMSKIRGFLQKMFEPKKKELLKTLSSNLDDAKHREEAKRNLEKEIITKREEIKKMNRIRFENEEIKKMNRIRFENEEMLKAVIRQYVDMADDQKKEYWKHWNYGYFNDWDVSNITDMSHLFMGIKEFNEPLDQWDVSNVTNMVFMFGSCRLFNRPLNSWNVRNVTDMTNMFWYCRSFNQPLNSWDVRNVTDMAGMFFECKNFNQPLNSWVIDNDTNITAMFRGCVKMSNENMPLLVRETYQKEKRLKGGKNKTKRTKKTKKRKTLKNRPTI